MPTFPYFNFGCTAPGELEYVNSERDEPMTNKQVIVGDEQAINPEAESSYPLPSAFDDLVERLRNTNRRFEQLGWRKDRDIADAANRLATTKKALEQRKNEILADIKKYGWDNHPTQGPYRQAFGELAGINLTLGALAGDGAKP